ncbi:TetR/AcrR family transcriptional regulator [Danxiaibacter flavus]|uniref:TetR/AcrR family transcriptional regulator n=1 Tax=Danxiaibacter flavus TaxID=3049108 RepID=A0ABV3ZK59_9BACT|nr:TetR/AcrR family transcriptional regulator [Chitinophagaceae bacterium DXS]
MLTTSVRREDIIQEQILQAAQQLFQKHGFQKVTMDDVAKAVGKGRSSIYYYYKNKDEIFDAVVNVEIKDILTELSKAVNEQSNTEEKIRAFCSTKIKVAKKKKGFFTAMEAGMNADEISLYSEKKSNISKRIMKEEGALLQQILMDGVKSKEFPAISSKDLEMMVFVLLCSLHGLKREMVFEKNSGRIEAAVNMLTKMAMQGIEK